MIGPIDHTLNFDDDKQESQFNAIELSMALRMQTPLHMKHKITRNKKSEFMKMYSQLNKNSHNLNNDITFDQRSATFDDRIITCSSNDGMNDYID